MIFRWLDAYRDANAFRFSTYFVSFVSESACLAMGIGTICRVSNTDDASGVKKDAISVKKIESSKLDKKELGSKSPLSKEKGLETQTKEDIVEW